MKTSIKKRLKKLEETLKEKSAPLDPVIIYDPEAPSSRNDMIPYLFYHKLIFRVDALANASYLLEPREFRFLSFSWLFSW